MTPEFEWDAQKAAENVKNHGVEFAEGLTVFADPLAMKRTAQRTRRDDSDSLRDENEFDYSGAKPNRFAPRMKQPVVAVVLEPDVAAVFDSSTKVNARLRSIIAERKRRRPQARARTHRRANKVNRAAAPLRKVHGARLIRVVSRLEPRRSRRRAFLNASAEQSLVEREVVTSRFSPVFVLERSQLEEPTDAQVTRLVAVITTTA